MKITDYFDTNVRDANLYANYRVIPSIDGLKNTQRKCLYVMQNQSGFNKVSNMASIISRNTEYLHGNASLEQVLSSLNINYSGSGNNLTVLEGKGQFGSKFNPDAIGASRYVYTSKGKLFDYIYKKEDIPIYDKVYFEGVRIEPKTLLPILIPLYNMQYSIGAGFASFILPRNPKLLSKLLIDKLNNKDTNSNLLPYIDGWNGKVEHVEGNKYRFRGVWKKLTNNKIEITELKPFIGLEDYLNHLDKLIDNKIIKSYNDESINNNFKFIINIPTNFWEAYPDNDKIERVLNIVEDLTENLTMFDENNKIIEYKNIDEYVDYFITWRLGKYELRQKYYIGIKEEELSKLKEKHRFIKCVLNGDIKIDNSLTKDKMEKFLQDNNFKSISVLMNIPVYTFTMDELNKLETLINEKEKDLNEYKNTTPRDIWVSEIEELLEVI